jgi:hypothetical protein
MHTSPPCVAVLGAGGRTGRLVVQELLAQGYEVRGLYQSPSPSLPKEVTAVIGDTRNRDTLAELLENCDGLISCIGHTATSGNDPQTRMVTHIQEIVGARPFRFVMQSGIGLHQEGDPVTPIHSLLTLGLRLVDPWRVRDAEAAVSILRQGSLNWAVLRCPLLTNHSADSFSLVCHPHPWHQLHIPRAACAKALVQLYTSTDSCRMPVIAS